MNAKTTRLLKEARPLFWPWCAVTVAALLPLVNRLDFTLAISLIGFWAGIPLLAALPLGSEFQHRTLSLLLAQPVDRMEIWREKLSVTVVALLSTALVFFFVWGMVPIGLEPQDFPFVGAWIIGIFASATFWTLFTRSTLGGAVLNAGIHIFIIIFSWNHLAGRIHAAVHLSGADVSIVTILAFGFLCYAGAMFWVGRRALARFQVTGGLAGSDLLMAGPSLMPESLAGWFRCHPTGAVLNLIRKELRLLRPLWLITLLAVVAWTCLAISGFPENWSTKNPSAPVIVALAVGIFSSLIPAILAGSLSLGEERISGTHAWHMTLPVSARLQWLIKLFMALFAGVVCAALLPAVVLVAGRIQPASTLPFVNLQIWMLYVLVLTFAAFWCACAVNSTVRAAMWVFPVIIALSLVVGFGASAAGQLMAHLIPRFEFFSDFRFINPVSKLPCIYFPGVRYINTVSQSSAIFSIVGPMRIYLLIEGLFFVPILAFAVVQSYRLFRAQAQDSLSPLIRNLLPLATMAFLFSFSLVAYFSLVGTAIQGMNSLFYEANQAIEKIQPDTAKLDATHPLQLTVEDLAQASPLSEPTRRWLRNARISIALTPDKLKFGEPKSWYLVSIHLASGLDCTFTSFRVGPYDWLGTTVGPRYGFLGGACK